jgi:hypothetical protein
MAAGLDDAFLSRSADRPLTRPVGMVYWLDEAPPTVSAIGLAPQHAAIQSVYVVIPAALAGSLSPEPADASRFLCLSILAVAPPSGLSPA